MAVTASGSAKCKLETCNNSTTTVYCWQHWYLSVAPTEAAAGSNRVEKLTQSGKPTIEPEKGAASSSSEVPYPASSTQVWADAKKVFVELPEEIDPAGIRSQVRFMAEGAATTAALRFARDERLEVDAKTRDKDIENFTSDVIEKLVPHDSLILQEDAEFIANAVPADGLGGFSDYEDARALISYGVRKEWELANAMGLKESTDSIPYDIPFPNFLSVVYNNDIAPHVLTAARREASDFHENVVIATGSKAANPQEVNPKGALPSRAETEPIQSAYFDEAREWKAQNDASRKAQEEAQAEAEKINQERIQARTEAVSAILDGAADFVKTGARALAGTGQFMDKLFGTRPEDIERERKIHHQRNRDIFYEMATRRERRRRGIY